MADWDVIAKQRVAEDWGTLRASYLPLNQAMRRTVEFLEKGNGTFSDVMAVARERLEGCLVNLTTLGNRRSPWVRLEAIRNIRVLATGIRGAASDDPMALLRYLFAISELLSGVWKIKECSPTDGRIATNLRLIGAPDFCLTCDCCAVGTLAPCGPRDVPDLEKGREVGLVWEVDALFTWTRDEFEDYLAGGRGALLPTAAKIAATDDLSLPIIEVPSELLRRVDDLFELEGGYLVVPLDLRYVDVFMAESVSRRENGRGSV